MLGRSVTFNLLGQAASLGLGFVASIVLARWLGPADRGLLALMLSMVSLAYVVTALGLPTSVEYHAGRPGVRQGSLLGATLAWAAVVTVVVLPAAWLWHEPLADVVSRGRGGDTWMLAATLVPLMFLQWTTANQLSGTLRFGVYNSLWSASRALYLVAVLVLLLGFGLGVSSGLIATGLAAVFVFAGALRIVLADDRPRFERAVLRRVLVFGARYQPALLFSELNYRLGALVLQAFRPLAEVGQFVVAQIVAELVMTLATAFQRSVVPLVARDVDAGGGETTQTALRHHGILSALAIVVVAAGAVPLVLFGFGSDFSDALPPLFILLPGMWFFGTGAVISADLRGRGRPGLASVLSGAAVAVTLVLALALVPPLGAEGAALASVAGYTVYGVSSLVMLASVSGLSLRTLVVPTRGDLALYPRAARALARRLR